METARLRAAALGTGTATVPEAMVRASSPGELPSPERGYGLFVCLPSRGEEGRKLLRQLADDPRRSAVLRVTFAPGGMDLPGVTIGSEWLLSKLLDLAEGEAPLRAPCRGWSGLLTRAMEGQLLPLLVHNVNNLMVGAMGNLDLATLFSGQGQRCSEKLEEASRAMHALSDFMSDLGGLSRTLPDAGVPAGWDALQAVCTMGRLACGRSVSLEVTPSTLPAAGPMCEGDCLDTRTLRLVCSSLMTAALLSLGGCGSIRLTVDADLPSIHLAWKRGTGDATPAADSAAIGATLAAAMVSLPPQDAALRIPTCSPGEGEALLLPRLGAS
ncbi:MAG: hypothetical protein R6U36_04420 [Candidatus Fermentibacteraceae bacterium]